MTTTIDKHKVVFLEKNKKVHVLEVKKIIINIGETGIFVDHVGDITIKDLLDGIATLIVQASYNEKIFTNIPRKDRIMALAEFITNTIIEKEEIKEED